MERRAREYWDSIAVGFRVSPPLAPSAEDIRWFEARAEASAGTIVERPALILGITPPLLTMRWPTGGRALVVDWSGPMLEQRWPQARVAAGISSLRADWRALPIPAASIAFAAGDGCYTALGDPEDVPRFNRELHRVLAPGAALCLRCFVLPERPLTLDEISHRLRSGALSNPSLFRWLFAMAVHGDAADGVVLGAVWERFRERFPDLDELRREHGWDEVALAGFERWKGRTMRYCFHSLARLRELAAPHFAVESVEVPSYEFGERFPRLSLRRR